MSYIIENLNQTIIYWKQLLPDGYGGFTFDSPVEILGRWEDKSQLFINNAGQEIKSSSVVFVKQDISEGDFLFLGEISDIDSGLLDTPEDVPNAKQVRGFRKIPNIDASDFERKVWL